MQLCSILLLLLRYGSNDGSKLLQSVKKSVLPFAFKCMPKASSTKHTIDQCCILINFLMSREIWTFLLDPGSKKKKKKSNAK